MYCVAHSTRSRPAKWLNNCLTQQNSLPKGQPQGGTKTNCFCVGKNLKTSSGLRLENLAQTGAGVQGWLFQERRDEGMFFWSRLEREGVGSDDGGRAFGAQSAPNHWAERGKAESQVCATAAS